MEGEFEIDEGEGDFEGEPGSGEEVEPFEEGEFEE